MTRKRNRFSSLFFILFRQFCNAKNCGSLCSSSLVFFMSYVFKKSCNLIMQFLCDFLMENQVLNLFTKQTHLISLRSTEHPPLSGRNSPLIKGVVHKARGFYVASLTNKKFSARSSCFFIKKWFYKSNIFIYKKSREVRLDFFKNIYCVSKWQFSI